MKTVRWVFVLRCLPSAGTLVRHARFFSFAGVALDITIVSITIQIDAMSCVVP